MDFPFCSAKTNENTLCHQFKSWLSGAEEETLYSGQNDHFNLLVVPGGSKVLADSLLGNCDRYIPPHTEA